MRFYTFLRCRRPYHAIQCKFIPVLFEGTWQESTPYWATGKLGIDLTGNNIKSEMSKLMRTLNNDLTAPSNPAPKEGDEGV